MFHDRLPLPHCNSLKEKGGIKVNYYVYVRICQDHTMRYPNVNLPGRIGEPYSSTTILTLGKPAIATNQGFTPVLKAGYAAKILP